LPQLTQGSAERVEPEISLTFSPLHAVEKGGQLDKFSPRI
jgi:hypothetical protein